MKRVASGVLILAVCLFMSASGFAQGKGKGAAHSGKPATTGVDHAETKANAHGQQGLENAETKKAEHKGTTTGSAKSKGHGKKKGHAKAPAKQ